jgi:heme-degrading monooxygenase HmoA
MPEIAGTPKPPYYAVIFTSILTEDDHGYSEMADRMMELALQQPGFLGVESLRQDMGITVSYWSSLEAINHWKQNSEHLVAQEYGRSQWYADFRIRISKVVRDYGS